MKLFRLITTLASVLAVVASGAAQAGSIFSLNPGPNSVDSGSNREASTGVPLTDFERGLRRWPDLTVAWSAEDRSLSIIHDQIAAKARRASGEFGVEIDSLEFAYGVVVPLPPAVAMGVVGLAGVGLLPLRRRMAT